MGSNLLRCLSTLPTADAEEVINDDLIPLITRLDPNDDSDPASEAAGLPPWLQNYYYLFGEQVMQGNKYLIPELFIRALYEGRSKGRVIFISSLSGLILILPEEDHKITFATSNDTITQSKKFEEIKSMVEDCGAYMSCSHQFEHLLIM